MKDKLHEFDAEGIQVTWSKARCIHFAACVQGLPDVFEPGRRPWVMPGNAAADEVAAVVMRCPTGALHYRRSDGGRPEPTPDRNWVQVSRSGPLYARGAMELLAEGGEVVARERRVALCRCGGSRNPPFCDNHHLGNGFRDAGEFAEELLAPPVLPATPASPTPGGSPLRITPQPDGPLRLEGHFQMLSGNGRQRATAGSAKLCRCGQSGTKPFCDGSHRTAGFRAP
jgi:CDGSH-type Zn-finger protein/uncharacterized Fe-S cluster protein YjdI